jgi:hypothetical protein
LRVGLFNPNPTRVLFFGAFLWFFFFLGVVLD